MGSTVIVALPAVDDVVNKISSEKQAHLTLLFLGEASLSAEATLYIQHACAELDPFMLSVDYRDTLGSEDADVLFLKQDEWDIEPVARFRHYLLLNDEIKKAYDSAEQFPEWTPHITLGYPETPANKNEELRRYSFIDFDRIALWTEDYAGPEFRLRRDNHAMEVAMSDISAVDRGKAAVDEIFHYGTKGMKWGVRKSDSKGRGVVKRTATKANTALDAGVKVVREGEKKLIFLPQKNRNKAAAATQMQVLATAVAVNQSPQFKGKDLKGNTRLKNAYFKKVESEARKIYADELGIARTEAWADFLGSEVDTTGLRITAVSNRISHSEDEDLETLLLLKWELDELGQIVDVGLPDEFLEHTEDLSLELFHYGKKGMKWGVRNNADGTVSVDQTKVKNSLRKTDQPVTVTQRKAGTYVQAKGGKRQTASTDAVKAQASRQKAKRSTTDSLSTKELKDAIERMRLEQEFAKLNKKVSRKGESFVARLFQDPKVREAGADMLMKTAAKGVS